MVSVVLEIFDKLMNYQSLIQRTESRTKESSNEELGTFPEDPYRDHRKLLRVQTVLRNTGAHTGAHQLCINSVSPCVFAHFH